MWVKLTHLLTVVILVTLFLTASHLFTSLEVFWPSGGRYCEQNFYLWVCAATLLCRLNDATKRPVKVLVLAYPRSNISSQVNLVNPSNSVKLIKVSIVLLQVRLVSGGWADSYPSKCFLFLWTTTFLSCKGQVIWYTSKRYNIFTMLPPMPTQSTLVPVLVSCRQRWKNQLTPNREIFTRHVLSCLKSTL